LVDFHQWLFTKVRDQLCDRPLVATRLDISDRRTYEGLALVVKATTLDFPLPFLDNSLCNLGPISACASVKEDPEIGIAAIIVR
jgi:hypothetical protein